MTHMTFGEEVRDLCHFLKGLSHSTALALTLKMPLLLSYFPLNLQLLHFGSALPRSFPWILSPILSLCTCKRSSSSTFLCTGSTCYPQPPPCPQRAQTPLWSPSGPPHRTQGCHAHPQKHGHWLLPPPSLLGHPQAFTTTSSKQLWRQLQRKTDRQTVEENGYYTAAGLSKGLTPIHVLLCGLVPCIVPPGANAGCLCTVRGVFPMTASKSKQIYTPATRRSPDNTLSGFLSLMRSISHGDQDYHSFL